jgi:hypothetical protein
MRINKPTDEVPCWREETKISTHLRYAAGICVLTTGLLIGSASGAIAAADPESSDSTTASQGADESSPSVGTTSTPTTTDAQTSTQSTHPTLRDIIRRLQEQGKPRTRPVLVTEPTTVPAAPDTETDSNGAPNAAPVASEPVASDSTVVAPESNSTEQQPNNTDFVASDSTKPAPAPSPPPPPLATVVVQPVTHAIATVAGAASSVPGVIVSLPSSETPVVDVITAVENILISVNDAVVPLAQVPFDLYTLLVVEGMASTPVVTVGNSVAAGLFASGTPAAAAPPLTPVPPPVPPAYPVAGMPLLGHVSAPAALGGAATVGLSANLSLAGTAPIAADSAVPTTALSLLEHTVKAVLAPVSLSALAAFALPGVGGLLIICAAGIRFGYRQAKAALTVRTTGISRFARQGPLGVVRSGSLVAVYPRRPRTLRVIRPERSGAAPPLEEAA